MSPERLQKITLMPASNVKMFDRSSRIDDQLTQRKLQLEMENSMVENSIKRNNSLDEIQPRNLEDDVAPQEPHNIRISSQIAGFGNDSNDVSPLL